jgi:hypothetical protein
MRASEAAPTDVRRPFVVPGSIVVGNVASARSASAGNVASQPSSVHTNLPSFVPAHEAAMAQRLAGAVAPSWFDGARARGTCGT